MGIFETGLDALFDVFLIVDSSMRVDILNALQKRFVEDISLVEDDPETRAGELLANVSKEILQSAAEKNWTKFEAAQIYFEELCQIDETALPKISNDSVTEMSPLFRDMDETGSSPLSLNSSLDLDLDQDPSVGLLSTAVINPESGSSLEESWTGNDTASLCIDKDSEPEEPDKSELCTGDYNMMKKEEEGTVTTFADSLDETFSLEPSTCREFSVVVNGTLYTGAESATNSSFCGDDSISSEDSDFEGETMKDRNRRLLTQERKSQSLKRVRRSKQSGKHAKHSPSLMVIKEEANGSDEEDCKSEAEISSAVNLSNQEETIEDVRSREIVSMLKKRTVKCRHGTRVRSRIKTKKNRSLVKLTSVVGRSFLPVVFSKIIRLYSCSAFRYAMFRSNRRYKPGD